jgi:hypothetical protein
VVTRPAAVCRVGQHQRGTSFLLRDLRLCIVLSASGRGHREPLERQWAPIWQEPATVAQLDPGNAADAITASPTLAGHAYLIWGNWDHQYNFPMTNFLMSARTTDGGPAGRPPT